MKERKLTHTTPAMIQLLVTAILLMYIQIDEDGNIYLRAERSGTGSGRIYTITYSATDASGNSSSVSASVSVPHNQ